MKLSYREIDVTNINPRVFKDEPRGHTLVIFDSPLVPGQFVVVTSSPVKVSHRTQLLTRQEIQDRYAIKLDYESNICTESDKADRITGDRCSGTFEEE